MRWSAAALRPLTLVPLRTWRFRGSALAGRCSGSLSPAASAVNLAAPLPVNPGLRNWRLVMMSVSVDPLSTNAHTSLAAETAAAGS